MYSQEPSGVLPSYYFTSIPEESRAQKIYRQSLLFLHSWIPMSDDGGTLFGLNRTALLVIGGVLALIGIILFISAASTFAAPSGPFDFAAEQSRMFSAFGTAVVGMILLGAGGIAIRFGMVRPVTSYLASEASPAIERASEAVGAGLREGYGNRPLQGQTVVKVKCRNCGHLNDEDETFCGQCGKPL